MNQINELLFTISKEVEVGGRGGRKEGGGFLIFNILSCQSVCVCVLVNVFKDSNKDEVKKKCQETV